MTTFLIAFWDQAASLAVDTAPVNFWHWDSGQITVAMLIAIVGWFIKREIQQVGRRLDLHEQSLLNITSKMSTVIGEVSMFMRLYRSPITRRDDQ